MATTMYSPSSPDSGIRWGSVAKGVAIVSAVVLAGVVGFYGFTYGAEALIGLLGDSPTASALASRAIDTGAQITSFLGAQANAGIAIVSDFWQSIPTRFGLTGVIADHAAGIVSTAGIAGAGIAAATATHAAVPHLNQLNAAPTPVDMPTDTLAAQQHGSVLSSIQTSLGATPLSAHAMHDMTHMSHHAAEHTVESPRNNWASKFTGSSNFASRADAVQAAKAERPALAPRDSSYASQLNADRANLEAILTK